MPPAPGPAGATRNLHRRRLLRHFAPLLALAFLFLGACDDSPTELPTADSVQIEGPASLAPGDTAQATASVFDADGNLLADHPVEWSSSEEDVATISATGLISADSTGTATITATADGASDSLVLTVQEDPCATPVGEITLDEPVEGELTEESCFLEQWFHDAWLFRVEEEISVQIDLVSDDFDAYVILTDDAGNELAFDDDSGEGDNARMEGALQPADYFIWASTFEESETGVYQLSVTEVEAATTTVESASRRRLP